eukprot:g7331.t1
MGLFWSLEALPHAITALLPLALFPPLGVLPAAACARAYFQDKVVLFFGGLVLASAVENSGLHRRIALAGLRRIGRSPRRLVLGFLCIAAFLSMWMSNTATAALMLPIAQAVLRDADAAGAGAGLGKALMLSVAYGANIGGMATLTGTGPNIVLAGVLQSLYADTLPAGADLSYGEWMLFALPLSLLMLATAFWVLDAGCLRD